MIKNNTPGLNGEFYWFNGVVENYDDPLKLGGLRVRIIGKDSPDLACQPSERLPMAITLRPSTMSNMSIDVKPCDWVFGFFLDGPVKQQPVIVGVYPGIYRANCDSSMGYSSQLTSEALQKEPAPPAGIIANANTKDLPSTGSPQMSRGNLTGTLIAQTNAAVIHSCDIATQLKRSVLWEKLKHSRLVQAIRDLIERIKKALGFSPDAISQRYIEIAQWFAGKLKTLSKMLKEFNDLAAISIEYVKILRAIIDWIMSLPARLKAALQECLQQFLKGITSAVSDVLSLPGAENTPENASLTDALRDVKTSFDSLSVQTNITLQLPSQVLTAITTPASSKDIAALDSVVTDFISDKAKENENVITNPLNSMTSA